MALLFCLVFYAISTVIQLFNGDGSQIHVSWTIFNQYLTSPLSRHWRASSSAIPIILSAKGKATTTSFNNFGLSRPGIEPMTSLSRGGHTNHYATVVFFFFFFYLLVSDLSFSCLSVCFSCLSLSGLVSSCFDCENLGNPFCIISEKSESGNRKSASLFGKGTISDSF